MNYFVILRGLPGSGKTQWVANKGIDEYTISLKQFRNMTTGIITTPDNNKTNYQNGKDIYDKFLLPILEYRMQRGLLTIIDDAHTTAESISYYDDIIKKYNYKRIIVEFPNKHNYPQLNQSRRAYDCIDIELYNQLLKEFNTPLPVDMQCDVETSLNWEIPSLKCVNLNSYKQIVIFGDNIGNYLTQIRYYFEKYPFNNDSFYIFLGNYYPNYKTENNTDETLLTLYALGTMPNVRFITGYLDKCMLDEQTYNINTIILGFTIPVFSFEYDNKKYICAHGGTSTPYVDARIASYQLIEGIGNQEDLADISDKSFSSYSLLNYYLIRGRFNASNKPTLPTSDTPRVYNLHNEDNTDFRILILNKGDKICK